jgi:xanthine dehydrogenase YagR molybdenum-binding subunit
MAAAIAGAVYHATGVRVRELPIKIEDLLMPAAGELHEDAPTQGSELVRLA